MNKLAMEWIQCFKKAMNWSKIVSVVRSPVNDRSLQFGCAKVKHEIVKQCYEERRKGIGLLLYRRIMLVVYWALEEQIGCRIHG